MAFWGQDDERYIQLTKEEPEASKENTMINAYRWIVEKIHYAMNRFRRELIRWGKKAENDEAMLYLIMQARSLE